jgi:hypothetical protein
MLQSAAAAVKSAVPASIAAGPVGFDKLRVRAVDLCATQPRDAGARHYGIYMAPAAHFSLGDPSFVTICGIDLLAAVSGALYTYRGEEIAFGFAEDTPRADDRLAALPPTAPRDRARRSASGFRFGVAERKSLPAPQNRPERRGKGWVR